jgi:hypothetical protein
MHNEQSRIFCTRRGKLMECGVLVFSLVYLFSPGGPGLQPGCLRQCCQRLDQHAGTSSSGTAH